jgi:hypothetical protein
MLAPNRPASRGYQRQLFGVKQTQCGHAATSESDPKVTSRRSPRCDPSPSFRGKLFTGVAEQFDDYVATLPAHL